MPLDVSAYTLGRAGERGSWRMARNRRTERFTGGDLHVAAYVEQSVLTYGRRSDVGAMRESSRGMARDRLRIHGQGPSPVCASRSADDNKEQL